MKKIGIVTVHHYHNYGSMLQAFATQYALEKMCKCKAEIIDVCPPGMFYASKEIYDFEHPSDYDFCMKTFRKKILQKAEFWTSCIIHGFSELFNGYITIKIKKK